MQYYINHVMRAEEKLAEEEPMESTDDWENCKGQCGYTRFCRKCMEERDRLIREKILAIRERVDDER